MMLMMCYTPLQGIVQVLWKVRYGLPGLFLQLLPVGDVVLGMSIFVVFLVCFSHAE